jgi:NAD+ synthase
MEDWHDLGEEIAAWIRDYAEGSQITTLVVGVSGGIDSSVTSTLCAKTGLDTIVLNMPIHQEVEQFDRSELHINWLKSNWENVSSHLVELSRTFDSLCEKDLREHALSDLALANTRARLRMATLYAIAGSKNGIVVGTGNKVEDFGVGFFTKYGDGGVDISPIADLYKSDVYALAEALEILEEIQEAAPTDGLWDDGRTDEEQMGATYEELEWAMEQMENRSSDGWNDRQMEVMEIFQRLNIANSHKMSPIPVFLMSRDHADD